MFLINLRILIDDGNIAQHLEVRIEDLLMLALERYDNNSYPIRNCACMLFASIMMRVFPNAVCNFLRLK